MQADQIALIKSAFEERGESVAEWARAHGFSLHMVYAVLAGRCRAKRGQGHQISVALGLKAPPQTSHK